MFEGCLRFFHMQKVILTRPEKTHFFWLSGFFLLTSLFDMMGIGAISYFLIVMMQPSVTSLIPMLGHHYTHGKVLLFVGSIMLVVFFIKTLLNCILQKHLLSYCFKITSRIRVHLMTHYLYAPYSYFMNHHTSEVISRIVNHTNNYTVLNLIPLMTILVNSIFVLAITIFMLVWAPIATLLLVLLFTFTLMGCAFLTKNKLYNAGQTINFTGQKMVQTIQESFASLKEVRVLSKEAYFLNVLQVMSRLNAETQGVVSMFQKLPFYFLETLMFTFIILFCLAEFSMGTETQQIVASCGTLITASIRLLPSLYQIATSLMSMKGSQHTLELIYQDLTELQTQGARFLEREGGPCIQQNNAKENFSVIQLDNVSYRYPEKQKEALSNISFVIKKGQSIGIIGHSGAGKSTLVDLILGLLSPESGQILVDGKSISNIDAWVHKFAYIPQSIYLLNASIKQNIVFGDAESAIDITKLQKATSMAQLDNMLLNLPYGLETIIGENGIGLSGGQRQRVALARAFYHEREIIVMDEATASLDLATEAQVVSAIEQLYQLKTLIVIAHRYSTVRNCDVIYRLQEGKIVASGSYEAVIGADEVTSFIPNAPEATVSVVQ